jgi:hypothetical protein
MTIQKQIKEYITSHKEPKRSDLENLHHIILEMMPKCKLWFLDGKNEENKIVSNPNIGYGLQVIKYADGKTRDFYKIGMSANTTGISIYIMGIEDKKYLANTFAEKIGKASITSYYLKFKKLDDINLETLKEAIQSVL